MAIKFRPGARTNGVEAAVAEAELTRIHGANGGVLSAQAVVDAARPEAAPLHAIFEWDDGLAGEQYRLMQSRTMIRSVVVVTDTPERRETQRWVHVEHGNYQPLDVVIKRPDLYELAYRELQLKWASAERALKALEDAAAGSTQPDRMAAIGLAVQGFSAVRAALAVLK